MILNSPYITGSLTVTGNITASGGITISGSIASSSYATNAERLDNLDSTSFVFTSSYNTDSASVSTRVTKIEGNYATTGSNVFMGAQTVCANITSTGTIIAQTLNVQQVTSSIVYSSGSNIFGCDLSNVQQMTGSVRITGSLSVSGTSTVSSGNFIVTNNQNGASRLSICNTICNPSAITELTINSDACSGFASIGKYSTAVNAYKIISPKDMYVYNETGGDIGILNNISTGNIKFAAGGSSTTQVFISGSGNVGIGTSTPSNLLTIDGISNAAKISIERDTVGTNTIIGYLDFTNNNGGTTYGRVLGGRNAAGDGYVALGTGVSTNLYALESGNVGIGTSTPGAPLQVLTTDTGNGVIFRYIGGSNNPGLFIATEESTRHVKLTASGTSVSGQLLQLGAEGNTGVLNVGASNVGIGTTSPNISAAAAGSTVLTLAATSTGRNAVIELNGCRTTSSDFVGYLRFFNNTAATPLAEIYALRGASDVSGSLAFATSGTEVMRITCTGNVGIGTTGITNKLIVLGCQTGTQVTTVPIGKFVNTGNEFSKFIVGSDNINYDAVISMDNCATLACTKLRFYIGNGTNSTPGHSNDQIVLQGNGYVGIGTTTPNALLTLQSCDSCFIFSILGNGGNSRLNVGTESANVYMRSQNSVQLRLGVDSTNILALLSTGVACVGGNLSVCGALSKSSGTFRINHPLPYKKCTHALVHSFIEGPQADLIYRGKASLINGIACIDIDCAARMTQGTFEALNRCVQVFTTNESSWDQVKGKVVGNTLIIESQNSESTDDISWMVIGERQDEHMFETEWTDHEGRVITEPEVKES